MAYVRQHPEYPKFRVKHGVMPDFSGSNYVDQERPKGPRDGGKKAFTLDYTPLKNSETIYKDGMLMARASSLMFSDGDYFIDYSVEPARIIFSNNQVPQDKSVILVNYKYLPVA